MVGPHSVGGWWSVGRLVGWSAFGRWSVDWGWLVGWSVGQSKVGGWLSDWWSVCWSVRVWLLVGLLVSWFWSVGRSVKGRWSVEWLVVSWSGGQLAIFWAGWLVGWSMFCRRR